MVCLIFFIEMVGVFDILYMPLGNPVDHFLLCFEALEAEKTRLYLSSSPCVWLLLELARGGQKRLVSQWRKRLVDWFFPLTPFCWKVAKFLHWSPELWSEALKFICRYVHISLETAISTFFLCPVGLKCSCIYPCFCLSQRVLLFLLSCP